MVFGLGGIGLNVIQGAKMVDANRIIGVDINPRRVELAKKFGMTHFINTKETDNLVDHIVQLTDGGTDCIMFLFGNSERSRKCIRMARYRSLMYASIRAFSPGRDADRTRSAS
jgi:S-(hydroxymethyl)glutathione dehydrogenase / alcohol dehydrogenase